MKEITVTNQAIPAKGRSENYRNTVGQVFTGGGGSATQQVVATGGAADTAKVAQNLAEDSTDWAKILRKDIDERTENALSIGKNLTVDGQALLNDVVANTGTFGGLLKAAAATITGALLASTVNATTMNANTFVGDLIGNANTATRLQTPRTIWGQSFDGSSDVNGDFILSKSRPLIKLIGREDGTTIMFSASDDTPRAKITYDGNTTDGTFRLDTSFSNIALMPASGTVGINTTTPAYALDVNGNMRVTSDIYADATVGTRNFASHTTGWRADANGNADFRNIYADELRVQAFTADISQALAGSDYLTKSVSKLSANFVVPSVNSTVRIIVDDIEGMPATQCFSNNDYIRFRAFNRTSGLTIANVWGTVTLDTTFGTNGFLNGTQAYTFTCKATTGDGLTVFKGSEVLDYGTSGNGLIARTTLDAMGSPYEQIATWVNDPSNGNNYTVHARLGNLNGIANCNGYGLYTDNGFFTGKVTVGDLTKTNHYLDFSNGALTVKGNIYLASGYAAVSTLDMSNGISLAVDNIHVGARNLLLNSKGRFQPHGNVIDNYQYYPSSTIYLENGKQYILSGVTNGEFSYIHDTSTESNRCCVWMAGGGYYVIVSNPDTGTTGNVFTWSYPTGTYQLRINGYKSDNSTYAEYIKIEEGNKKTTWYPAPEDVDASINLKVSKDGIIGAINLTSEAATISASKINLVGAVTASSIVAGAVTADKIAANSITSDKVNMSEFTASNGFVDSFNANVIATKRLNVAKIVADGIAAQTIDAQNATITNLKMVTADVIGKITATSGAIGPFTISQLDGLTATSGDQSLLLKARLIRFTGGTTSAVYIGTDVVPGSWGGSFTCPVRVEESRATTTSGNVGMYLSVMGASVSDSTDYISNSALFIDRGVITGFRTRQRRLNYSQTVSLLDTTIIDTSTGSDSTYTLPTPNEDGQRYEFITTDRNIKVKPSSGQTLQYSTDTHIYTSSEYINVLAHNYLLCIYNAVGSRWIVRDMGASY